MNKNIIFLTALLSSTIVFSQVGIDTETPKATLDVMAKPTDNTKTDGFIAPRLTGDQLKAKDLKYGSDQIGTMIYVTSAVSSTTPKTVNVTEAGYYYFDGIVWVKFKAPVSALNEPWYNQADATQAHQNTQDIYQMGSVAVKRNSVYKDENNNKVSFDVAGAIRSGNAQKGIIGTNSVAFGSANTASGTNSLSIGNNNVSSNSNTVAIGNGSIASGQNAFAGGGNSSLAIGAYAFSFGNGSQAIANHAIAMGVGTVAPARSSVSLGRYNINSFTTSDPTNNAIGDPIFQLGAGSDDAKRWNSITSFYGGTANSGWTAIGGESVNVLPTRTSNNETLRVFGGALANSAYVADINSVTGTTADKLVVADIATGQLKTIDASKITTVYKEPWNIQGGSAPANANNQNIYQNGYVAIKRNAVYTDGTNFVSLDVSGAVRGGAGQSGSIGTNSAAFGLFNTASGSNSLATGNNVKAVGGNSFATGNGSNALGTNSIAFGNGSRAEGNNSLAGGDASKAFGNNSLAFGLSAQTGASSDNSFAFGASSKTVYNNGIALGAGTVSPVRSGIALGRFNAYTDVNTSGSNLNNAPGEPLFQVGQGLDDSRRTNIITAFNGTALNGAFGNGWVVIGAEAPISEQSGSLSPRLGSERLTVYGAIASTGAINAGGAVNGSVSTYPDYVFQNYYSGNSTLNPNYKFSNLYETEKFIKENHHLPGVTSVNELEKTENGYSINIGATATQALEKVEELYLHTIEQQKQIDELKDTVKQQQEQIKALLSK